MIFKTSIDKLSRGCLANKRTGEPCGNVGELRFELCSDCQAQLTLLQNLSKQEEDKIMEFVRNHPQAITQGYLDLLLKELSKL